VPASLVVVNPRAARARDPRTLAALAEHLGGVLRRRDGVAPRLAESVSVEGVAPLVRGALREGVASVIGVGGDGTLHHIAAALAGTGVPLGIVPAGTGNQVASVLGVPRSAAEAIDALEHARPRTIDLGEVSVTTDTGTSANTTFILGCGAGFDARLMATTSPSLKRRIGTAAYFVQGARLALRLTATPCQVDVDGRALEVAATTVLIGNMGQLVPGRLALRLPLDPGDGLLDLIIVGATGPIVALRGLLDQLRRSELGGRSGDGSVRLRGRHIRVAPREPLPLQIDGDHVGLGGLDARVRPDALTLLVPSA
jgi:diacylglycerol kinase family enzyme